MEIAGYIFALLAGVSLGLIGGGGSILIIPILVYLMGITPILATSYSLFIVGFTCMVGAINNYRKGLVRIKIALLFGLSSVTTVFIIRKLVMPAIPSVLVKTPGFSITQSMATMILFAILMMIASVAMIKDKQEIITANSTPAQNENNIYKLLLYGILIGLATGFLGAGGGFLVIPALVIFLNMPMKEAVGTSLLIIALNSLIGFTGDMGHYIINWRFLISVTLIAIAGIFAGGILAKKIEGDKLKKAFGWFILIMGIYILIKEIFFQ